MAKWLWPCPGNNTITSGVGPRWGTTHKGIDISAPRGASIVASRSGEVISIYTTCTHNYGKNKSCGCGGGYGNYVYIDHKDGYITRYAHMTAVNVKVGDRVHQGKVIGTVGSTGYSTGNHLHFEVRKGSIVKDPEQYVNPSNTLPDTSYSGNLTDRGYPSSTEDIANDYDNPTSAISEYVDAVMTRDFIEGRPFHAYLKIFIGDKELSYEHGKPSIIQSFEINRLEGAGDRAQFVLFDDNWDDIEVYLADNWNNISIQYGYSESESLPSSKTLSPRYKMLLQDYSIDFKNTGTILNIQAISEGIYKNLNPIDSFDTGTKNPAKAIKSICTMMGWDIDYSDFVGTADVDREEDYKLVNVNPLTYIYKYIIPEAKSYTGGTFGLGSSNYIPNGYDRVADTETVVFFLDETNTAHLRTKSYGSDDESLPTYVYMKGYDSVVKELSFQVKGVFGGTTQFKTVTGLKSGIFNNSDKSEDTVTTDQGSSLVTSPGEWSHTDEKQSIISHTTAGETKDQIEAILNYHVKNGANQAYEATMTILGDPSIQIMQEVRLVNITDSGHLHHTSGVYLVTGISDSIQNGSFLTTLTLRRNGDISNGIILRHPKSLRK